MRIGIRVGGIGREEYRSHDRFEFDLDARLLAGLLDDRLRLLARRVDGSLEDELQRLAVLGANAVATLFPAGSFQDLVGFLDVEFEFGLFRPVTFRVVQEVGRGDRGAAIDELLDRTAIDQEVDGLANCRIAGIAGRPKPVPR